MTEVHGLVAPWDLLVSPDRSGGDTENFHFSLSGIAVGGEQEMLLPSPGVTIIVGSNNVGKSTLLRQIMQWLSRNPGEFVAQPAVLTNLSFNKGSDVRDIIPWLGSNAGYTVADPTSPGFVRPGTQTLSPQLVRSLWEGQWGDDRLGPLASFLLQYADAQQRFSWVQPTDRRADISAPALHPMQLLEDNEQVLEEFLETSRTIFGQNLTLDRLSGQLMLRSGTPGVEAPAVDRVTKEYRQAVAALPGLHVQGDGIKSALGLLMPIATATYPVVLIDEPEAFLHPPQARALGFALGSIASKKKLQILVATHDKNFVSGLLESRDNDTSVIRLTRVGTTTTAKQLAADELRKLWDQPMLRYTNVLDGLFHRLVVLAENERDCKFYAAALDAANEQQELQIPPNDVLFVPTGGKHGMAVMARTLTALGVPIVASPDVDIINDEEVLKKLVESLGRSDWSALQGNYAIAIAEFHEQRSIRLNRDIASVIVSILDETPDAKYGGEIKSRVDTALRVESRWKNLKNHGIDAFLAKPKAARDLFDDLDAAGVIAVRVGELERFAPDIETRKGDRWLAEALSSGAHKEPEAIAHVRRLIDHALQ